MNQEVGSHLTPTLPCTPALQPPHCEERVLLLVSPRAAVFCWSPEGGREQCEEHLAQTLSWTPLLPAIIEESMMCHSGLCHCQLGDLGHLSWLCLRFLICLMCGTIPVLSNSVWPGEVITQEMVVKAF